MTTVTIENAESKMTLTGKDANPCARMGFVTQDAWEAVAAFAGFAGEPCSMAPFDRCYTKSGRTHRLEVTPMIQDEYGRWWDDDDRAVILRVTVQ